MIGTTILGYTISKVIGAGGMARVYYAQNSIGKAVSIKVLKKQLSGDRLIQQRFRQEADIMKSLDDISGIRKVIDRISTPDGNLAIIMEYLDGMDLGQYIKQKGAIEDMLLICKQVLIALGEAHKRGVIHRDIKLSNLFLTNDGDIKLLDFGIAKILFGSDDDATERQTTTNKYMGTLSYMSPEQIMNLSDIDQRADIYSFGLTLFHFITGENPVYIDNDSLSAITDAQLLQAIKNATIKSRDRRTQDCTLFLKKSKNLKLRHS